jgi:hypothetical protein
MEPQAECMLVLIGATPEGKKELIGFQTGMRESTQSWKELLVDLKARGLSIAPEVAVGDGALGFWKALDETFPTTRYQRLLAAQDVERARQVSKVRSAAQCAQRPTRNLASAGSSDGGDGDCDIRREIRAEIRQGHRMADQGSRNAADIFRLSGRSYQGVKFHDEIEVAPEAKSAA